MAKTTITEALAEFKTIDARIVKKVEFINLYIARQEALKDPMEKDGGSAKVLLQERQALGDLFERKILLRQAIQSANADVMLEIRGKTRTIAEWLTWRREVAPVYQGFLEGLVKRLNMIRAEAKSKGFAVAQASAQIGDSKPSDVIVNIDEKKLADEREALEETLGLLDGLLSLKNATTTISV